VLRRQSLWGKKKERKKAVPEAIRFPATEAVDSKGRTSRLSILKKRVYELNEAGQGGGYFLMRHGLKGEG
jgi:hypothetical protein